MHIPDGYLSPSTCAALYAAVLPFWAAALRRVKALLATRFVPLVSLFAAFSFVIMMFNLPLPGGTTGHAVGIAMAAIVLGPWGATIAISVALAIQALLFGDGGILALGANCFNMAVAGSWTAAAVYRLIAGRSPIDARRRVIAGGLAGYCAINVAALLTAFELGLQPLLFHDATGAALYAPYPLGVALPAMMLGHLSFAGLAEGLLTAGVVRYLQQSERSLLEFGVSGAGGAGGTGASGPSPALGSARGLWAALGLLLVLSPLGLLAAGSAWGEWSPAELADPAARGEIAAASGGVAPPALVPSGLARLAAVWTAPLPDYAPAFLRSSAMGYIVSALVGVGLIVLAGVALQLVLERTRRRGPSAALPQA
jgi:cobalt/nickel transport system permease protein